MRYLTLAEALAIAEAVTGTNAATLARASRLELLDSALHAPQAGFGDEEFYPDFVDKAAVLVVRLARNHPLPDGNKRLAWQALTIFCALNGRRLDVPADDAVATMLAHRRRRTRRTSRCRLAQEAPRGSTDLARPTPTTRDITIPCPSVTNCYMSRTWLTADR